MSEQTTIEVENVGPILGPVRIPLSPGGGVTILRGENGCGKSTVIRAIEGLVRGKLTDVSARIGSTGGRVEGLGRRINVGLRRSTVSGELLVESIESSVDLSKLVDPGLKDAERADAQRIKVACVLANVQADPAAFTKLVEGIADVSDVLTDDAIGVADVVEMATRVRRDLHASALRDERQAEALRTRAAGMVVHVDEAAVAGAPEREAAHRDLETAVASRAKLAERLETARKRSAAAAEARKRLDEAASAYTGPTTTQARGAYEAAGKALETAERALRTAQQAFEAAQRAHQERALALQTAEQHERTLTAARDAIAADDPAEIPATEASLEVAEKRVAEARERVQAAELADSHRTAIASAGAARAEADAIDARAQQLRAAAWGTDDVLAGLLVRVLPEGLLIRGGRLVVLRGDRETFFADLSEGERWRFAIDLAIEAIGDVEAAVLWIDQTAWEGLDGNARRAIHAHAKARGIALVTAEADHDEVGELRAEVFGG